MKYERGSFITVASRDTLRGIHPTAQTLYMWLSSYANETGNCFPSRKTLANDCACSESMIDNMLVILEEEGLVKKRGRKEGDRQLSNLYTVLIKSPLPHGGTPPPTQYAPPSHDVRTNSNHLTQTIEDTGSLRSPDSGIEIVEVRDTEPPSRKESTATKQYASMCAWLEKLTGVRIVNRVKQYTHLKKAKAAGIDPGRLKARAVELFEEAFYQEHGLDWGSVVSSFDRRA